MFNKSLLTALFAAISISTFAQTLNPTPSINSSTPVDTFTGGYTFAYATSGAPWNGALISFGGLLNRYDCQISTDYAPGGGKHISFRTHNGDAANIWNPWYEIWHSGNLNNSNADFTAKNMTATNINTSGMHLTTGTYSTAQGAYLGWNMSHANGEFNFVNNIGGGTGGFTFDNTSNGTTFTRLVTVLGNGNVGVGTINPQNKLDVNGTIHSKSVLVDLNGWSDYVFKKDYQLPSLAEVKSYIDQNHHLPDMPSEQEVIKEGINLGEMNKLLTKKVEELTLYLIEKDKQLSEQQKKSEQQDRRIAALEAAVSKLTSSCTSK